jgi:hypothetical protein
MNFIRQIFEKCLNIKFHENRPFLLAWVKIHLRLCPKTAWHVLNKETHCKVTDYAICNFVLIVNGSGKLLSLFIVTSLMEPLTGVAVKCTGLSSSLCVCYRREQDTLWFHVASVHLCLCLLFSGAASRTKCNAGARKFKRFTGKSEYEVVSKNSDCFRIVD